jgi:AAA+ superfamily predicted ATPase
MDAPLPDWVVKLRESYLAGGASMFIVHGNVADVVGGPGPEGYIAEPTADFLTRRLFGAYDLVLHYDMGRGLRAVSAGDPARLTRMNSLLARLLGNQAEGVRDPSACLRLIDRLMSLLLVSEQDRSSKIAVLFDYADFICPADDRPGEHLATLLNWARSPVVRSVNMIFLLFTESLGRMHPVLVQSGHTEEVLVPLPDRGTRRAFIAGRFPDFEDDADRLSTFTSGLTLVNIETMMKRVPRGDGSAGATDAALTDLKKGLMEAQCPGLLEFVKPRLDLSDVAGHAAAKQRLTEDARLVREGRHGAVPMGYLICGPVGVGKTFLAMCYAGSAGIPCVTIRNFRSKYVGETEANLERILTVVRELGPVAVIVDEADASLGNREASGDSGTSARVFAQLASQMGDTSYRGRVIWFLLTCRPDLLPVDLKRQGRCEEHIPLFYPETPEDLRDMFLAMARKAGITLRNDDLPDFETMPPLSGADIEGVLMRANREALLRGKPVSAAIINGVLSHFRSTRGSAHELQETAAIIESTDMRYLPEALRHKLGEPGAYDILNRRFRELQLQERAGQL